jgi:hypothetical protein
METVETESDNNAKLIYSRLISQKLEKKQYHAIELIHKYIGDNKYILTKTLSDKIFNSMEINSKLTKLFTNSNVFYKELTTSHHTLPKTKKTFECEICYNQLDCVNNHVIKLYLCSHMLCLKCFLLCKKHNDIVCPFCRKKQNSKYKLLHSDDLYNKFVNQYKLFENELVNVITDYWKEKSNHGTDVYTKLLLEMNLVYDNFTLEPVKINTEIMSKIQLFESFNILGLSGNELIITKLLRLKLSREDLIDITFYRTCLNLKWFI